MLRPSLAALGPVIPLFVLSGATRLPHWLLRISGNMLSTVYPPLRRLMRIVDIMHHEMSVICDSRKAVSTDMSREHGKRELLGILGVFVHSSSICELHSAVISGSKPRRTSTKQ